MNFLGRTFALTPDQTPCAARTDLSHRPGAFGIVFGLPVLVYTFTFLCNDVTGCPAPGLLSPSTLTLDQLKREVGWPEEGIVGLYDTKVTLWTLSYYAFSLFLQVFLPGQEMDGVPLACHGRLKYKFNGMLNTGKKQDRNLSMSEQAEY
jgi:delta14-sterol reductase